MADWRQIQARIRKAKNAPDAQVKLSDLYARTHDAMVAWELATIEEKAERNFEAVKWYTVSAERFRRPEWKKRAEEALLRLGAPLPEPGAAMLKPNGEENTEAFHIPATPVMAGADDDPPAPMDENDEDEVPAGDEEQPVAAEGAASAADADALKKKRRRGRRGGRGRRKKVGGNGPSLATTPADAESPSVVSAAPASEGRSAVSPMTRGERGGTPKTTEAATPAMPSFREPMEAPRSKMVEMPSQRPVVERSSQGRAGDPALASRMAQLESMLRRLVASAAHKLDEADDAPAGPGVFLLSDSDQVTSYYIESCQTLRVAVGNIVRGGRGSKNPRAGRSYGEEDLKAKLAEHLGINESKVSQYMKEHCVIRWIQLDDDAAHLAHFAIGVLRTPLNVV